jgi:hypothetical protein
MGSTRYWLVNSGTTQEPWLDRLEARYRGWNATVGEVQAFSRRPTSIAVGDVLVHRAVGSDGNRLVAVADVMGAPIHTGRERWPWDLPRRLTAVARTLRDAPRAADVGIEAHGVRTYKELAEEAAVAAITRIDDVSAWSSR